MASSAEVIVLSSSPNPPSRTPTWPLRNSEKLLDGLPRRASPPSLLPSPSELFNPPSRSRFFPTPKTTDIATKKKPRATKKPVASASLDQNDPGKSRSMVASIASKTDSTRNANPEIQDTAEADNGEKKGKGPQKIRTNTSTKRKETGNMTLTGKVTKGGSGAQAKEPSKRKKKTTAPSERPDEPIDPVTLQGPEVDMKDRELHLDEALRRRMDWTPTRDTSPKIGLAMEGEGNTEKIQAPAITGGFDKLLSNYNYSGAASAVHEMPPNVGGGGPTKRRRIELVDPLLQPYQVYQADSNGQSSAQGTDSSTSGPKSKKKPKGPKRLTTLTARMTAQYTSKNADDDGSASDELQATTKTISKRRGKGKTTEDEIVFTVLSPEAAFRSLENQDLVFGTCSQLEREDSPHTLDEMQQAIRASEKLAFDGSQQTATAKPVLKGHVSYMPGTRNLWQSAARSTEGSLVQAQRMAGVKLAGLAGASKEPNSQTKRSLNWEDDDDWFELDYGKSKPSPKQNMPMRVNTPRSTAVPVSLEPLEPPVEADEAIAKTNPNQEAASQQPQMPHYSGFTDAELTKQVAAFGFKSKCWESKHGSGSKTTLVQSQAQSSSQTDNDTRLSNSTQPRCQDLTPQSETLKTATRTKGQTKKKTASAPSASSCSGQTDTRTETLASVNPKKISKHTYKCSQALTSSFIDVEEIQDSEDETAPSPSQVQKRYREILSTTSDLAPEPSLEIQTKELTTSPTKRKAVASKSKVKTKSSASASAKSDKPALSKRSSLPDLAFQITKAVRSQHLLSPLSSSTGSRSRPTWHEKILMYDPVILEDFTTWLNVEGLGLVGEDREVHAAAAREWCENKGICCCSKNNASW
ncbi:unnamed protein product [Penicillium pancosmium]